MNLAPLNPQLQLLWTPMPAPLPIRCGSAHHGQCMWWKSKLSLHDLAWEKLFWATDRLLEPKSHWMLEGSFIQPSVLLTPTPKGLTLRIRAAKYTTSLCTHMHTRMETNAHLPMWICLLCIFILGCTHLKHVSITPSFKTYLLSTYILAVVNCSLIGYQSLWASVVQSRYSL